jgi:SAM-dependent methyltransferase
LSETFDPSWLELREPVDHRSRPRQLLEPLREWWAEGGRSAVLDLGCGTGSNLRYLAPELPDARTWTLLDHDAGLLARAEEISRTRVGAHLELHIIQGDLAEEGLGAVARADLVTASALLDLVSEEWLRALASVCSHAGCAALFALTYDGVVEWRGAADPVDRIVLEAVNEHQRSDKGLGAALGPAAAFAAEAVFEDHGYRTRLVPSPWELGADDTLLGDALIDGWVAAAAELHPGRHDDLAAWAERRKTALATGDTRLKVGHLDLLALPGWD